MVGLCTAAAEDQGVRPGLRVGEALARCPDLELVLPDPAAAAEAGERVLCALEDMGAAVEPGEPGGAAFAAGGLGRLHGGLEGVLRRARAALPVGADGRLGAAPSRFAALQAAQEAPSRRPLVLGADEVAGFLAPLPAERLPLAREALEGARRAGPGHDGPGGRAPPGGGPRPLRPSRPARLGAGPGRRRPAAAPAPAAASPGGRVPLPRAGRRPAGPGGRGPAAARRAGRTGARARAGHPAALTLRARLADGGSWTRALALREATADPARLAAAALPRLGEVAAPVEALVVRVDASGHLGGRQLTVIETRADERGRRAREAVRQVRAAQGPEAVLRRSSSSPGRACPSGGGRSPPTSRSAAARWGPGPRPSGPSPAPGPSA